MFYVADILVTTNTTENIMFTGYFEFFYIYITGFRLIHTYNNNKRHLDYSYYLLNDATLTVTCGIARQLQRKCTTLHKVLLELQSFQMLRPRGENVDLSRSPTMSSAWAPRLGFLKSNNNISPLLSAPKPCPTAESSLG